MNAGIGSTVYSAKQHSLSLSDIDADVLDVIRRLRAAGYSAYLTGGAVRNLLLGRTPRDFDIVVSARPSQVRRLFRHSKIWKGISKTHNPYCLCFHFRGKGIDIFLPTTKDFRKGDPIKEVVLRFDFTFNTLCYDPENEILIDYCGGFLDIKKKCLKIIRSPLSLFKRDPQVMMRLIRFSSLLGFKWGPEIQAALDRFKKSSFAVHPKGILRILEEQPEMAYKCFELIQKQGLLDFSFPELAQFLRGKGSRELLGEVQSSFAHVHLDSLKTILLFASLLFPLLEENLQIGEAKEKVAHLLGRPLFSFCPRRLKTTLSRLLVSQFQFTENGRPTPSLRHSAIFPLALKFLQIRAAVDPSLKKRLDQAYLAYAA